VFRRAGLSVEALAGGVNPRAMAEAFEELIALAHGHLQNAFAYTIAIPREQTGIRRFLLWALGLAVLTLRKLHGNAAFLDGESVKVSRRMVKATVMTTSLAVQNDWVLSRLMELSSGQLPLTIPTLRPLSAPMAVSAL
jgi:farnesyl-diphosphate farnesyltransferase